MNASSAASRTNLITSFWIIVAVIMISVLKIDWGFKTVEALEEGSMKDPPLRDSSPPCLKPALASFCRTGQRPAAEWP